VNDTREPLVVRAAVVAFLDAIVHLVVLFGVDLTAEQVAGVSGVLNLGSILAVVLLTRGKVTPVDDPRLGGPSGSVDYDPRHGED
jgi:hypothetical protein